MTAGLMGSGTEANPWLIGTSAEMSSVLRDPAGSGYYRVIADIYSDEIYTFIGAITSQAVADGYAPKVIDGNGYGVHFYASGSALFVCFAAGVHFKNIKIKLTLADSSSASGTHYLYPFYKCSIDDTVLQLDIFNAYSRAVTVSLPHLPAGTKALIPSSFSRVVMLGYRGAGNPISFPIGSVLGSVTAQQAYAYSNVSVGSGITKVTESPTLAMLDGLTMGSFSAAGWWQAGLEIWPFQTEAVVLTLQTIASGSSASRRMWVENERWLRYVGDTDAAGLAQLNVRIRKWTGFTVYASEDLGADFLRNDQLVVTGGLYLPPTDTGFVYVANTPGRISSLEGVTFGDQPITIDGIEFSPRSVYRAVMSERRSVQRNGSTQTLVLDNAGGGGGPIIEGDPAYLDGIVEEIHPITGARQALANCEVVAFERRGSDYVAMGSTYSDGIGGFRLKTDVYGGGDVFAFAADFPGVIFQPGIPLNVGDRIRPALANGYVYEIIQPGTAGPAEPVWWPDQGGGTEGDIGTARARARPYYQPVGHGPLKMTLIE